MKLHFNSILSKHPKGIRIEYDGITALRKFRSIFGRYGRSHSHYSLGLHTRLDSRNRRVEMDESTRSVCYNELHTPKPGHYEMSKWTNPFASFLEAI